MLAQAADVGEEAVGAAGGVGADQDRRCRAGAASGICARAWSRTVMWSAVVFDPARPSRSSPDSASRVLSRKQNSGW